MKVGEFEATECPRPMIGGLIGTRHVQTEHGPADLFVNRDTGDVYMRVWLNREGVDDIVWFRLEKRKK